MKKNNELPFGLTLELYNNLNRSIVLADIPEFYLSMLTLAEGENYSYEHKDYYSLYFPISKNIGGTISINGYQINPGESLNIQNAPLDIKAISGVCHLIVSGFNGKLYKSKETANPIHLKQNEIYRVNKPWGHELWLNNNFGSEYFSLKEVFIKQGFQTSLQYHEKKMECALLYEGTCEVFFTSLLNEAGGIEKNNLASRILNPLSKIFVKPNTIHRMKAMSDMYHYEISTPELDDVIRLIDDSNRGHGRIHNEHK
jgi:hypothetical protein